MFIFIFIQILVSFASPQNLSLHLPNRFFQLSFRNSLHLPQNCPSKTAYLLTSVHLPRIRNLKAIACLGKKCYLCIEMSWKGLISRMSDECLMKQETVVSYCYDCQAVMRKFTLAGKSQTCVQGEHSCTHT